MRNATTPNGYSISWHPARVKIRTKDIFNFSNCYGFTPILVVECKNRLIIIEEHGIYKGVVAKSIPTKDFRARTLTGHDFRSLYGILKKDLSAKLLDTLTGANATLLSYANSKIEKIDTRKQILVKEIADLTVETVSPEQIGKISDYLDDWEGISFDDKRQVLDGLVARIHATSERVEIE